MNKLSNIFTVPRVAHVDISDVDHMMKSKRIRSSVKLMFVAIETSIWLTSDKDASDTTRPMFDNFVNSTISPANHGIDLTSADLWFARNGALHTSSKYGQRPVKDARWINWNFDRNCGCHGHVMSWPTRSEVNSSVNVSLNKFWGITRQVMYEELSKAVVESRDRVIEKLQTQAMYSDYSRRPESGFVRARPMDCATGEPIESAKPIFIKQQPDFVRIRLLADDTDKQPLFSGDSSL